MKISKIEKKKRLYLIEFDNEEKLYVTEDTIVRFMLSKEMDISAETLKEIKAFTQFSHGKNLALYFISFQTRTDKEVRDYLLKNDIDGAIIDKIISNLTHEKWIDDHKYLDAYLNQNDLNGDKGPLVIKQKLIQKGLSTSLIDSALAQKNYDQLAEKVANKVLKKYQNKLPHRALKDKLIQSLINKGFYYELAKSIVADLEFEDDEDDNTALLEKEAEKQFRKLSKKHDNYDLKQRLFQALYRKGFESDAINKILQDYL
ncbi:recombination regulator RecX [Streptococcus didelphis]|uniref:Regulatory protein RecX n=1 Tax=Streptococcus didelphis TaxID=102886 RepID=A0ABY9LGI6_9STRE|nr:recombination regulator RecX [Streptococcus didelphis]WMB28007.1 recombination regulator RecX [Streptococcus didelphis]